MTKTDYTARAELFLGSSEEAAAAQGARAFRTAAHAIRFALEQAAPVSLRGARLRIGTRSFSGTDIKKLYHSHQYPLARRDDVVDRAA
jgi:hypothetical protein